jgi:hypothetical protein
MAERPFALARGRSPGLRQLATSSGLLTPRRPPPDTCLATTIRGCRKRSDLRCQVNPTIGGCRLRGRRRVARMTPPIDLSVFATEQRLMASEATNNYAAAARVRLTLAGHESPVDLRIRDETSNATVACLWERPSDVHLRTYRDKNECTDWAANAVVLSAALRRLGMLGFERCQTGTGSDWYLVAYDSEPPDMINLDFDRTDILRLEISGIADDSPATMADRVREKIGQLRAPNHPIPGIAGVAGFGSLTVQFRWS